MNTSKIFRLLITKMIESVCLSALLPLSALASPILWVNNGGELATVDLSNGNITSTNGNAADVEDIAFAPDGTLYGVSSFLQGLYTINTSTGARFLVGATGTAITEIGFGPDGTLYGAASDGDLVTIDPATAATNVVGFMGLNLLAPEATGGLTFVGSALYTFDIGANLYRIDPQTGAATEVGATQPFTGGEAIKGLSSPDNATLYGVTDVFEGTGDNLYTLNTSTAVASLALNFGGNGQLSGIEGIAFSPQSATPEPATILLASLGLLLGTSRFRSKGD